MLKRIVSAGFSGQGVLTFGMILAEAAASQGKYVTWTPEYGSAMRGGWSCTKVKISDDEIISPFMEKMDVLVALSEEAIDNFAESVIENGYILVEESLMENIGDYPNRKVIGVPATEIAEKNDNAKGMSIVMVGASIAAADLFPIDVATAAVVSYFEHKGYPVEKNKAVFIDGYNYVKENMK